MVVTKAFQAGVIFVDFNHNTINVHADLPTLLATPNSAHFYSPAASKFFLKNVPPLVTQ